MMVCGLPDDIFIDPGMGMVRFERMSDTCFWGCIYLNDVDDNPRRVSFCFNAVDGRIEMTLEEDT